MWRMKNEPNSEEINMFGILVRNRTARIKPVLQTLHVRGNICIARQTALVNTSTVDEEAWICHVGIGWLFLLGRGILDGGYGG